MTKQTTKTTKCLACGNGTLTGNTYLRCSYCGAGVEAFTGTEHVHHMGMRCNGLSRCVGHRYLGCDHTEYDSQWGAGIFNDWPRGHHKPYGA